MHRIFYTCLAHTPQLPPEVWGPQDRASQRAAGQALRAHLGRVPLSESLAGPGVYAWAQGVLAQADAPADERQAPLAGVLCVGHNLQLGMYV